MDILDPQIWLILVGLIHAVVGVILPGVWSDDTYKMTGGFMLLTTVTMLYAAFMMDGEEQARMALVIAGPIWVWFVIVCALGLTWTMGEKSTQMTWKENTPPLVLWGICALSGLLGSGWI